MTNIVDFRTGRPRPRRPILVPQDGAQILFFTGVRYFREGEEPAPSLAPEATLFLDASRVAQQLSSQAALDRAAY